MLRLFTTVLILLLNFTQPTIAMNTEEIGKLTDGQGVFTVALTNNTKYGQSVTVLTYATIEGNTTPFYSRSSVILLAGTSKTILVQKPVILGSGVFTKDCGFLASTPDDRKKMTLLTVKLTTVGSTGRKDKSFIMTPGYYENTRFANVTNITHIIAE